MKFSKLSLWDKVQYVAMWIFIGIFVAGMVYVTYQMMTYPGEDIRMVFYR